MKKLFISQPMNGKSEEEILAVRKNAIESAKVMFNEDVEVIESYFEDVGNHVSNGVRNRSCEIGKGGTLTAGSVCFLYSFVQFGFCLFDNGKDDLVIFRTLQRNHLLSVLIVPRGWQ